MRRETAADETSDRAQSSSPARTEPAAEARSQSRILAEVSAPKDLDSRLGDVIAFLDQAPLRSTVAELEIALAGCGVSDVAGVIAGHGVTSELLQSAVAARNTFGKINDVIHATAIALSLQHVLESGETLARPSLAAGNTPIRLFDVETDVRIAEFKLARWDGNDGGRQKTAVKDLARLAADNSGRRAELYLLGARPISWLRTTTSSVRAKLKGYPAELSAFENTFDDPDIPISAFVATAAAHVRLINLEQLLPHLFSPGSGQ